MAITRVNSASITGQSSVQTATATVPSGTGIQANDLIVVSANSNGTHATNGISVQDNVNTTNYTTVKEQDLTNASARWLQTFYFKTPLAIADGSTFTVTGYSGSNSTGLAVDIFRGAQNVFDQGPVGASPTPASANVSTIAFAAAPLSGSLVVTFVSFSTTASLTVTSPFTIGSSNNNTPGVANAFVLGADGASTYGVTNAWTNGSSQSNATVSISFLASPSAGGGVAPATRQMPNFPYIQVFRAGPL